MSASKKKEIGPYAGFEQGPIRPPSEAKSLLIRITRNCPWNHCTFCPVYKGETFSLRPLDHVLADIDAVTAHVRALFGMADASGKISEIALNSYYTSLQPEDRMAFAAAANWFSNGMSSIFLQDADSLIIKPEDMLCILKHLIACFPNVLRITSYARSHTIARIKDAHLAAMRQAGLNRIHIGLESGSDAVLSLVKKGVDKKTHVLAGQKIKNAGMELSEYVMPGLGGKALSLDHAVETADALNQINPDFIRIRTLAVPEHTPLHGDIVAGRFQPLTDIEAARELLAFLERLDGITSIVKSDHILNLFEEVDGRYPEDKPRLTGVVRRFLDMAPRRRLLYQVGRRLGLFSRLDDLDHRSDITDKVAEICLQHGITPDNADSAIREWMKRFI